MTSATDTDWSVAGCKAKRGIIAERLAMFRHELGLDQPVWKQFLDYGNNLRAQAQQEGVANAFDIPGFVPEYVRPLFCEGKGPFRWAALSGDPADIHATDQLALQVEYAKGAIGYIGFDGGMDTNIAIRTLTVSHGSVRFWAGGGIVADSQAESEYQESFDKAGALLRLMRQCFVQASASE